MLWENKMALCQLEGLGKLYTETFPVIDGRLRNLFTAGDLLSIKKVYVLGDGDSYHAAMASRMAFLNLTSVEYFAVPAMRFLAYESECMKDYSPGQSLVVGISASGGSQRVVQCLKKAREKLPDARFMALTGRVDSVVARAADIVFDAGLPDPGKGMAPGVRTYTASLFGLVALAIRLGEIQNRYHMSEGNDMRARIAAQGEAVDRTCREAIAGAEAVRRYAKAPYFVFVGCGNHFGSASFSAAKFTEIAGLFCVPQDLEEWMHIERLSYPLDAPLVVLAAKGASFGHALHIMETAKKLGHPRIVITDDPENKDLKGLADILFPIYGELEEHFMQLLFYMPSVAMGVALSNELGRAMFMTDNEEIVKQRTAMTANLKEDV